MQHDLNFRHPSNDGFIVLNSSVLQQIDRYRQRASHHTEAGGILMGMRRGRHIEITIATTPKREDTRTRTAFHRVSLFHQRFAIRGWQRFGETLDYVGEWHTHPEHNPAPSWVDRGEWAKLMRVHRSELVFVILGITGLWVGLSARGTVKALRRYDEPSAPTIV